MMQPDAHEHWSDLLPLYVNGRLEGEDREQLARHLAECARCREDLAGWREIARMARQPHPGEWRLQAAPASLAILHQRITAQSAAHAKGSYPMHPSIPPVTPSSQSERRKGFSAIAVVALLAMFVVTGFAMFRTHNGGHASVPNVATKSTKTPAPTALPAPTCSISSVTYGKGGTFQATTGQSVTVHGITMTLDTFYTDYTRTFVTVHVQTPASQPAPYGPYDGSITPENGTAISLGFGGSLGNTSAGVRNWEGYALLPAQSAGVLGTHQTATLTVNRMELENGKFDHFLTGPWQVRFAFTSVSPHSVENLNCAPQTHQGFSMQVLSVVQAPAPLQYDGYPGGIAVGVCFVGGKGDPYNDPLFDELYQSAIFGGMSPLGIVHPPESEPLLTLPDGTQVKPQYEQHPTPACRINGKAGLVYNLHYLTETSAFTGRAIFTVPTIYPDQNQFPPVDGPWTFSFDLK